MPRTASSEMAPSRMSRLIDVCRRDIVDLCDIADAPDRLDAKRRRFQPAPDARNVQLECVRVDGVLISEELIHEALPRHDLSGIEDEQLEQAKLPARQFDSLAGGHDRLRGNIDRQVAELDPA